MKFALQTASGTNYLTAVNGGGIGGPNDATCPVHTDANRAGSWEFFTLLVDDTVNPPTAKIVPFLFLPFGGSHYLTAVNGGGVGGPNTQPVHTDATKVGPWEQFSLSLPAPPDLTKIGLNWNTNVNGPEDGNIAGSISLNLAQNGSYSFSGSMNNSNHLPNNISAAVVVLSTNGIAFTFAVSGKIDANLPWDNNTWNWSNSGVNAAIQANWGDLQPGYSWYWKVDASLDGGALLNGLLAGINTGVQVVKTVVAVVALFS